jgi:hypothetical protein
VGTFKPSSAVPITPPVVLGSGGPQQRFCWKKCTILPLRISPISVGSSPASTTVPVLAAPCSPCVDCSLPSARLSPEGSRLNAWPLCALRMPITERRPLPRYLVSCPSRSWSSRYLCVVVLCVLVLSDYVLPVPVTRLLVKAISVPLIQDRRPGNEGSEEANGDNTS